MEKSEPLPDNIDPDSYVGMTQYRYKDLPKWVRQQLIFPPKQKQKIKSDIFNIRLNTVTHYDSLW